MPYSAGTGALDSYEDVRVKEDVSDIIGLISPEDTPLYSMLRKTECHNKLYEWQEDFLRSPNLTNAQVEGFEAVDPTTLTVNKGPSGGVAGLPTVKQNYTQIFTETAQTSGSVQNMEWYGRANEHDYQVMKKGLEVRRDIEAILLHDQASVAGNAAAARKMASVPRLISGYAAVNGIDNTTVGTSTTSYTVYSAGANQNFTEASLLLAHQGCFRLGGQPNILLIPPVLSLVVGDFAYRAMPVATPAAAVRQREVTGTEIINVVELYKSPFGTLVVTIDKWANGTLAGDTECDALLLQTDAWGAPTLEPMNTVPLAQTGHNRKTMIVAEMTLAHLNGNASGRVTGIKTTYTLGYGG